MLVGCMGRNSLTEKIVKFNLTTAESRWGREGLFVGMWVTLVYPVCALVDVFIINSIEFWSGANPISGKSPVLELPMDEVRKMGFNNVERAQIERVCDNWAKVYLDFENGDKMTFDVFRGAESYNISYRGVELYQRRFDAPIVAL